MKRIQVLLMAVILFLSGCSQVVGETKNDDHQLSNDEGIVVDHSVEDEVNAIAVIRQMFEEDLSKEEIDAYVEQNINHLSSEEIDEVAIKLLNRLLVSKLMIEDNFSDDVIVEQIINRFDEETNTYDFTLLSEDLAFIKDAKKYGVIFESEDTYILYNVADDSFDIYEGKISDDVALYVDILSNSSFFYGEYPATEGEILDDAINTIKKIDDLLMSYDGDLIQYLGLMKKVYLFNFDMLNMFTINDELTTSYKNQTKLSESFIGVLESMYDEYDGIPGLFMTTSFIKNVEENNYVMNKDSYEKISKGPNSEDMKSFCVLYKTLIEIEKSKKPEKQHIIVQLSEPKNQEKPILSYDALIGQIQNGESLPSVFKELENSANSLSSKERDDVYYKMLMRSMNKAIELNEMLQDTHFHKELELIYDEVSQTYNINSTSSKEVELYIKELKNNGCILKKQEEQLYCNLDRKTFLEYEEYITETLRKMMLVYIGYNESQFDAVNNLEVEYLVTFLQMGNLEDIILDESLNPEYYYGLLELQYNFLKMLIYEIPAQYPRFEAYLNGEGSLPDEIGTFYAALGQEYPDKMFIRIPIMYMYSMMQNNYEHTEFTLTLLNAFKNNTDEEKDYIISVYDDLLKENIEK